MSLKNVPLFLQYNSGIFGGFLHLMSLCTSWKGMNTVQKSYKICNLALTLSSIVADLLFTYKLVFGLIDASLRDFFIPRFNESRRRHDYKLYLPTCKSNIRSNSFNYRVIQKWNSLPSSIDTSLKRFRKSLAFELLLPYCKVFLFGWLCCAYRQYYVFCILNYF